MLFAKILLHIIESFTQRVSINFKRITDHTWREITGKPTLTRSMITPQLYLGGQYGSRGATVLRKIGVTAVVSMRRDLPFNPTRFGLKSLHLPTPDQHPPTIAHLKKGITFISEELRNSGKVYIHCRWGEGRGPTMAAAYLISTGLTTDDALKMLKKVRTFINPTNSQIDRLRELETELLMMKQKD